MTPSAKDDAIAGWRDGVLLVKVRATPERGKANESLCRLLARELGVAVSAVSVVRGVASRDKLVDIDGLDEARVTEIISAGRSAIVK